MKSFFLYLVTGLFSLFILFSFATVAADVSMLPTLAIAGSLLLFFLAPPLLLFRPKWGASAAFLGVGLVFLWLLGFFLSTLSDYIVAGLTDEAALPMLAPCFFWPSWVYRGFRLTGSCSSEKTFFGTRACPASSGGLSGHWA
jgi:hypothetical protein